MYYEQMKLLIRDIYSRALEDMYHFQRDVSIRQQVRSIMFLFTSNFSNILNIDAETLIKLYEKENNIPEYLSLVDKNNHLLDIYCCTSGKVNISLLERRYALWLEKKKKIKK